MYVTDLINDLKQNDIQLRIENGKLCFHPKSGVTPDILEVLRQYKQQILVYLIRQQGGAEPLYINPPICHNPFTPHASHGNPWECDPDSCYCYQHFGYPRFCKGVPCRWIWPKGSTVEEGRK